jgi:hypothetical protein
MLLQQSELQKVLGRKLLARLVAAGLIQPVPINGTGIFFDSHRLHLALSRLAARHDNAFHFETRNCTQSLDEISRIRRISSWIEPEPKYVIEITLHLIVYLKSSVAVVDSDAPKLIRLLSFLREFQRNRSGHSIKQE